MSRNEEDNKTDGSAIELRDDFDAALPAGEPLDRARLLAKLEGSLFDVPEEPVKLGRFLIVGRLGAGGMGVVYKAFDPKLDRRVAVKVVSAGSDDKSAAHRRLVREAKALARLSHPNVVPVYEVDVLGDQVFVVMEFVIGHTLRAWVDDEQPSWREILAAYLQAGRGLAAAHANGLIHRDFKPDNAIIGDDQRVRVLDFGLARDLPGAVLGSPENSSDGEPSAATPGDRTTRPEAPGDEEPDGDALSGERDQQRTADLAIDDTVTARPTAGGSLLTATNAIVGTPAYMAPEQFARQKTGPASDQFGFCVALYEALYDQRPYDGRTLAELSRTTSEGRIHQPPSQSQVPGWLYPVLRRGLAPDPDDRHPSMDALLATLEDDPVRKRRRRLGALAVVAAIAISSGVALYSLTRPAAASACLDTGQEIALVWTDERRDGLEETLRAIGLAYVDEAWPRIERGLDAYAERWADMRQEACQTHQRGLQSGELLDKRMACLDRRKTAMASAIAVLAETDASSLLRAVEVVQKLPPLEYCGDTAALAAEIPPPDDLEIAGRVEALREKLSLANAQLNAGRYRDAQKIAQTVVDEAETLAYKPLLAEGLLLVGHSTISLGPPSRAISALHRATGVGIAAGADAIALEAIARRIYSDSTSQAATPERTAILRELLVPLGESLAERTPDSAFGHALLLNNVGTTFLASQDRARAREYFEKALTIESKARLHYPELGAISRNLAMVTPDEERRVALLEDLMTRLERDLGPSHPMTLSRRMTLAKTISAPRRARDVLAPACESYPAHSALVVRWADCVYYLSFLEAELSHRERAATYLDRLSEMPSSLTDTDPSSRNTELFYSELARGYAAIYRDRPAAAMETLSHAAARYGEDPRAWWLEKQVAMARLGLGLAELALERYGAATPRFEYAVAIFERIAENNYNTDNMRWLALARVGLATSLWHSATGATLSEQRARARGLIERSRTWYRSAGDDYERRQTWLQSWPDSNEPMP